MIPPITDPMGAYWNQPSRDDILVDEQYAVMTMPTFTALLEYSTSLPSGVYDGKMWRRTDRESCVNWLAWYGPSDKPGMCSISHREILLV